LHGGLEKVALHISQLLHMKLSAALPLTMMKLVYCPLVWNEMNCTVLEQGTASTAMAVYMVVYNN